MFVVKGNISIHVNLKLRLELLKYKENNNKIRHTRLIITSKLHCNMLLLSPTLLYSGISSM